MARGFGPYAANNTMKRGGAQISKDESLVTTFRNMDADRMQEQRAMTEDVIRMIRNNRNARG
jgi:hypothetical protein